MRNHGEIARFIYSSVSNVVQLNKGDKQECLNLIRWAREIDIAEHMREDEINRWNQDSIRWTIIKWIKEAMGFTKECPNCLEDDSEFIDYIEQVTRKDVTVVKCKKCGKQYGY